MKYPKLGIIKEEKVPVDRRVPVTPHQAFTLKHNFPGIEVLVQSSEIRCYQDEEYRNQGIAVNDHVTDADILLGVKEVPISSLIEGKTYLFFSHTIKKQTYNRALLQALLSKKIRMIDYECLVDDLGQRLIAFGRWAGIVGAYNGLWTYGVRTGAYQLRRASECHDLADLLTELPKIRLASIKIVVTGGGRVAKGALEILSAAGIEEVSPSDFLSKNFAYPVFTRLDNGDYNRHKEGLTFRNEEFFATPEEFEGDFLKYTLVADLLIAAAYWDPRAPKLFEESDMSNPAFNIKVIADITCDIDGSIPSTKRPSTIADPVYDYDPLSGSTLPPFSDSRHINVMAIDNLPCELPRDASHDFGQMLIQEIMPSLIGNDDNGIIERATICQNGYLMPRFAYLQDFVNGK